LINNKIKKNQVNKLFKIKKILIKKWGQNLTDKKIKKNENYLGFFLKVLKSFF
jgi:hypothetical protein